MMKERITLTVSAVRRSQYLDGSDSPRVWYKAVFPISGTLGNTARIMGIGDEVSILLDRHDEETDISTKQGVEV